MTREEAIDILRSYLMFDKSNMQIDIALNMAIEALSERPKGEWEEYTDCEGKTRTITCSECGWEEHSWLDTNFCPNCGADMRGEKECQRETMK